MQARSLLLAALVVLIVPLSGCLNDAPAAQLQDGALEPAQLAPVMYTATGPIDRAIALANETLAALLNTTVAWNSVDGRDGREPTVGVDSKGVIYYAARDYSGGNTPPVSSSQTPIMKSADGGMTWKDVSPRLPTGDREPPRSGDPMVWVDPWTDRIFQIELYDLVCNWLVYSDDAGESWTGNPKACGSLVVDHQTIVAGPPRNMLTTTVGYPNVVYVCVNQIADSHCARSLDGGLTFGTFTLVYPGITEEGCVAGGLHGHALVDATGTVYLPREYCGRAYVATSQDDGLTWTLKDVSPTLGASDQDPNMAFDDAGNVYYLFIGEDELPYLVWSPDQGTTWSEPVLVSAPDITATNLPSITAGSDGRIGIAYVGTKNTATPPDADTKWEEVTWDAYVTMTIDATSNAPTFVTMQANPIDEPIFRGDCTHTRCGLLREFIDASIAPDGTFYVAFIDACLDKCHTEGKDVEGGNGNLAYVAHITGGPSLWAGMGHADDGHAHSALARVLART